MRSKRPFRSLIVCVSCAMVGCIEDGHRAEDGHYGHVKLWAPLLEPPEVKK